MTTNKGWAKRLVLVLGMVWGATACGQHGGSEPLTGVVEAKLSATITSVAGGAGGASSLWSSKDTWDQRRVPIAGDVVHVATPVVFDDQDPPQLHAVIIDGSLTFDPDKSLILRTGHTAGEAPSGNVIVRGSGSLVMKPSSPAVTHQILFENVDEAAFVGPPASTDPDPMLPCKNGTSEPCDTDVGLWVQDAAVVDASGAAKSSWTRLSGNAHQSDTTITVEDASGWRAGDVLVIAPTSKPASPWTNAFWSGDYDTLAIATDPTDNVVTLRSPLLHDHLQVNGKWRAEVMNLTRNVKISGQPGHRAHIIFHHTTQRQDLEYVEVSYMGPQQAGQGILGRYGMHFHMATLPAADRSLLKGLSLHDLGFRAYVPHASDHITIQDCISHNTRNEALWWDHGATNDTNDLLLQHDIVSMALDAPGTRLGGFILGGGQGNQLVDSVAVGVDGTVQSSGFQWLENTIDSAWVFHDNIAHNNKNHGIFTWQNGDKVHLIEATSLYHNGGAGLEHGAYGNRYIYRNLDLFGNRAIGVILDASGTSEAINPLTFENVNIDGEGLTQHGFVVVNHSADPLGTTLIRNNRVKNLSSGGYAFVLAPNPNQVTKREWLTLQNNDFQVDAMHDASHLYSTAANVFPESDIFVQQWDGAQFALHPTSYSATNLEPFNGSSGSWSARWRQQPASGFGVVPALAANRGQLSTLYGSASLILFDGYQYAKNLEESATVRIASTTEHLGLVARRADSDRETYYKAEVGVSGFNLQISKVVDGAAAPPICSSATSALALNTDETLTFRVETLDDTTWLRAKLGGSGAPWAIECPDYEPRLTGTAGRFGMIGTVDSSGVVSYDDYQSTILDIITSTPATSLTQSFVPGGTPVVDPGPNQSTSLPGASIMLSGSARLGDVVSPPGVTYNWTEITGASGVVFSTPTNLITSALFPSAGMYTLRLTARSGSQIGYGDVRVVVVPAQAAGDVTESWTGTGGWPAQWSASPGSGAPLLDISSNRGRVRFTPGSSVELIKDHNAENVDLYTTLTLSDNAVNAGVVARLLDSDPDTFLSAHFGTTAFTADDFVISMFVDGQESVLAHMTSSYLKNVAWRVHFSALDNADGTIHLGANIWNASASEPAGWMLELPSWSNKLFQGRSGRFGVISYASLGARTVYFDDFKATFPPPPVQTTFLETWDGTVNGQPWPSTWVHEGNPMSVTNQSNKGQVWFGPANGFGLEYVNSHSAKDVDILACVRNTLNNASGGVFALRSDADAGTYLGVTFGTTAWDADAFRIAKYTPTNGWTRTDLSKMTSPFLDQSAYYWIRFQVLTNADGSITARAMGWKDGDAVPTTWQLQTPVGWDDSLFRSRVGRFGVIEGPGQLGRKLLFDSFQATFAEVAQ